MNHINCGNEIKRRLILAVVYAIKCNCIKKPEKIQDFNWVWTIYTDNYLINNSWSWLEDVSDCFLFYRLNNLSSSIGTNRLGMVVGCLTCGEHTNTLDDGGLAVVSSWAHCALPVGLVRPLGTNVVREAQAVNQFGFSSLWTFLNRMKRGGNVRVWMERDRLRLFPWHWYFYWLWTGVSKWRGGFVIWKKAKVLINHHKVIERCFFFSLL